MTAIREALSKAGIVGAISEDEVVAALTTLTALEAVAEAARAHHQVEQGVNAGTHCGSCHLPVASERDWETYGEGEGEHLCWDPGRCGWEPLDDTLDDLGAALARLAAVQDGQPSANTAIPTTAGIEQSAESACPCRVHGDPDGDCGEECG